MEALQDLQDKKSATLQALQALRNKKSQTFQPLQALPNVISRTFRPAFPCNTCLLSPTAILPASEPLPHPPNSPPQQTQSLRFECFSS